jgi:hypothetical protein
MTPNSRKWRKRETGLSEVIGFVLILGVLVLVFSLYLTYGIPAQGREKEILHMNEVKDQFIGYKVGVDSLWTNHQPETAMSTTFYLGTSGQTTQGSNSLIPIMQPVGSSGTMVINQRTTVPETLTITSNSLVMNNSRPPVAFPITGTGSLTFSDPSPPSGFKVYIDTTTATLSDVSVPYGLSANGTEQGNARWQVVINLTPRFNYAKYATYTGYNPGSGELTGEIIHEDYQYNRTDLTLTVFKGGNKTLDGFIIYSNIQNIPGNYSVNILDDSYGMKNYIAHDTIVIAPASNMSTPIRSSGEIKYLYQDQPLRYGPVPLGSLEYRSNNNYWIPQTYYYQMGGVFLSQQDGVSYKLPPAITFPKASGGPVNVSIVAIAYDTGIQQDIGGVSPVQIKTIMKSDSGDIPLAPVNPNTWNMSIHITTPDEKTMVMWKDYFNESAQSAGWPTSYYYVDNTTPSSYYDCYITIRGQNSLSDRNIDLKIKTVNLTAQLQGLGGIS